MDEAFTVTAHKHDNIHPGRFVPVMVAHGKGVKLMDVGGLGKICPFENDYVSFI